MGRKPGYYWICIDKRDSDEWIVALWTGKHWFTNNGFIEKLQNDSIPEIDERMIERRPKEEKGCLCNPIKSEIEDIKRLSNDVISLKYHDLISDIMQQIRESAITGGSSIGLPYSMEYAVVSNYFQRKGYDVTYQNMIIIIGW